MVSWVVPWVVSGVVSRVKSWVISWVISKLQTHILNCSGAVLKVFWVSSGAVLAVFWECSGYIFIFFYLILILTGVFWGCPGTAGALQGPLGEGNPADGDKWMWTQARQCYMFAALARAEAARGGGAPAGAL